ncbi:SUKH-3 domain-containing protein [Micromonospora cathayae]|uniref:SUKH-3 domain-containing protein n=1 Tax=Micromonospora cathayae TaxID=3028804 RepID=A0ABY7ZYB2_9ACTN|nr:SUKH-3 domain-containing protein [Micromonospora sp. HUAS 3]WDZ88069.1 SUKH-3 domain-containing protein [Micromonospora sp. HUAS 3]
MVHLHLRPWPDLAYVDEWRPEPQPVPHPNRFPQEVAHSLAAAGWQPHFGDDLLAEVAIDETCAAVGGERHSRIAAALGALTAFPSLASGRRGPGEQVWISRFQVDPLLVAHTAASLADFGAVPGVRLFPIGTERQDSILAVDEQGRVFALDQAGERFLGPDIDTALTTLLLGRAPARVHGDGTW